MSFYDLSLFEMHPKADGRFVVQGEKYRFTVLTERLIRMEYSEDGVFEDRATRLAFNRAFDTPEYEAYRRDGLLHIVTKYLHLTYDELPFSSAGLQIAINATKQYQTRYWYYGRTLSNNLGGTVRTLDGVNGAIRLPDGLLTERLGYSLVDDSKTIAIGEDGWPVPVTGERIDLYFFGYFQTPEECIKDFYKLSAPVPLLPRYALGNWWSRYYRYSQEEYLGLMDKFSEKNIPLAVGIVDMDWHITRAPDSTMKWTGFTWNTELFPDYKQFLADLHSRGLKVALNLHPRDGVLPDEAQYEDMCRATGFEPDGKPVEFDASDRRFMESYFEKILHPYENDGVDFWWMDWQQAGGCKKSGYDSLWMINHCHYLDGARGGKRPLNFSRYAEIGSHRYPIGFSGDTVISWESLDFQPYFTATASNVGFSWWSHDIGGFKPGVRDSELYTRWVQLGVFSPIFRLHSAPMSFISKEPWNWGDEAERIVGDFMRLRHRLIPYLYSMMYRNHEDGIPMIRPMYHVDPTNSAAYGVKNEYWFGSELIAAPVTSPRDTATGLSTVKVWLPSGKYIDFFGGRVYAGGRAFKVYRTLDSMPLFAKAGAIVPLADDGAVNGTANPNSLELRVFGGADGAFTMVEDNGKVSDALVTARTHFTFTYGEESVLTITSPKATEDIPKERTYRIGFVAFGAPASVMLDGDPLGFTYDAKHRTVVTDSFTLSEGSRSAVTVVTDGSLPENEINETVRSLLMQIRGSAHLLNTLGNIATRNEPASARLTEIFATDADDILKGALAEIIAEH